MSAENSTEKMDAVCSLRSTSLTTRIEEDFERPRQKCRKTGVTNLEAPDVVQLVRSTSRFSWASQPSAFVSSVKQQATSVFYQFYRRKRTRPPRSPLASPSSPPEVLSKSMEHVIPYEAESGVATTPHRPQKGILTRKTSLERQPCQCEPINYTKIGCQMQTALYEPDSALDHTGTCRTKRYSCSHVKFSDELGRREPEDSAQLERTSDKVRTSLPTTWNCNTTNQRLRALSVHCPSLSIDEPLGQSYMANQLSDSSQFTANDSERTGFWGPAAKSSGANTPTVAFKETIQSRTVTRFDDEPVGSVSESRGVQSVQSRFKQFWVESFATGRSRTKSENQTGIGIRGESLRGRNLGRVSPQIVYQKDVLPPHAHTVTGGSTQATSLLRRLAVYTNISGSPSEQSSIRSGTESLRRYGQPSPTNAATTDSRSGSVPLQVADRHNRHKSPRAGIGRFMSMSSGSGKSSEDMIGQMLPDPSKLPKEEPVSTLEFTGTKLKNPKKISQKFQAKSGFEVLRRKRAGSLSGGSGGGDRRSLTGAVSPIPRPFLLEHISKSDETLFSVADTAGRLATTLIVTNTSGGGASRPSSSVERLQQNSAHRHNQQQSLKSHQQGHPHPPVKPTGTHHHHHHHHHHWHRHGNHGHHRSRGHFGTHVHHVGRAAHTMTRVTESRRYLMFTRSLPFWSTKQYMETHGTGLGEAETYAVLFHHTPCYDLIPDSAKLVIFDCELTIVKAFKALLYNEIRAAPVWNSKTQSLSSMLTVTDFVQMLHLCWSEDKTEMNDKKSLEIDDFDRMTIQQWKDFIRPEQHTRSTAKRASVSGAISSTESRTIKSGSLSKKKHGSCNLPQVTSCPSSNISSPSRSRSRSSSSTPTSSSSQSSIASLPSNLSALPDGKPEEQTDPQTSDNKTPVPSSSSDAFWSTAFSALPTPRTTFITHSRLLTVDPEEDLFKSLRILSRFRLHYLPVIDCPQQRTGNILYILTHRRLLSYLFSKLPHLPQPRFLQSSLTDLNVGSFGRIVMVTLSTRLREAVALFSQVQVSALPVVDSLDNRRLITLFSKYDVISLILTGAYKKPELTIQEWLEECKPNQPPFSEQRVKPAVEICFASNNLLFVMEKLVKTGFRRLIVVNNTIDYRVEGVVTLSDVLRFSVLQQARGLNLHIQPPSVAEVADERDEADEDGGLNHRAELTSQQHSSTLGNNSKPPVSKKRQSKVRVTTPPRAGNPETEVHSRHTKHSQKFPLDSSDSKLSVTSKILAGDRHVSLPSVMDKTPVIPSA
ncbi:5'-AMP-activated protein kinase subunit gamma-1, variant 3 [Clonorchis sinensis]|uniref:5'-AMP-activated protein kinase subunit gamma-1, variant 3 n=2 Tax=Clonorchis sinensis TaxID=79923 RepID=A0A8T1MZI1_CLOSI|nr:5'-AMP-activated protein kinase subunit gamma-1, variant 3 [Clonorchis sinensis]